MVMKIKKNMKTMMIKLPAKEHDDNEDWKRMMTITMLLMTTMGDHFQTAHIMIKMICMMLLPKRIKHPLQKEVLER